MHCKRESGYMENEILKFMIGQVERNNGTITDSIKCLVEDYNAWKCYEISRNECKKESCIREIIDDIKPLIVTLNQIDALCSDTKEIRINVFRRKYIVDDLINDLRIPFTRVMQ